MALANQRAQGFNHEYIGPEHIFLGLVLEGSGVGANVLKDLGIDLRNFRLEIEKLIKPGPEGITMGKLPQTPQANKVIEYAIEEARAFDHNYVGTEHLLLGLLREREGIAAQALRNVDSKLTAELARETVRDVLDPAGKDARALIREFIHRQSHGLDANLVVYIHERWLIVEVGYEPQFGFIVFRLKNAEGKVIIRGISKKMLDVPENLADLIGSYLVVLSDPHYRVPKIVKELESEVKK